MKKVITALAAMLIAAAAFAQSGKTIYNRYSDEKKVSAVYISPSMFKMMGRLPEIDVPGKDIDVSPVVKELSGLYMLESENLKVNKALREDAERFIRNGNYEMILEAKDDGETVRIYTCGDATTITSLVMTSYEVDEYVFLCLEGKILRDDLDSLMAASMSKKKKRD